MHHSIEYPCCNSRNMLLQCTSEPAVVQWYSGRVVPSQSLSAEAQNPFCPAAAKPVARIYFLTFSTRSLCNKTKTMHFCAKQISPFSSTYPGQSVSPQVRNTFTNSAFDSPRIQILICPIKAQLLRWLKIQILKCLLSSSHIGTKVAPFQDKVSQWA